VGCVCKWGIFCALFDDTVQRRMVRMILTDDLKGRGSGLIDKLPRFLPEENHETFVRIP
jgi:hypothetical protein